MPTATLLTLTCAGGINLTKTPYPLMFCFVDASGRNKFYQTLVPDSAEAGSQYTNEFKYLVMTEAGGSTKDYADQPSSLWGNDFNDGASLVRPRASIVVRVLMVAFAPANAGTYWKLVVITMPVDGPPLIYINGAATNPTQGAGSVSGMYQFSKGAWQAWHVA